MLLVAAIGGVGAYVLQKSKAGTTNSANGLLMRADGYHTDPFSVPVQQVEYDITKALPDTCAYTIVSNGSQPAILWNSTHKLHACTKKIGDVSTDSLIITNLDNTAPTLIWKFESIQSSTEVYSFENSSDYTLSKDGQVSKIAYTSFEKKADGTAKSILWLGDTKTKEKKRT